MKHPIGTLPEEALIHIFSFLHTRELFTTCVVVSSYFYELLHSSQLWHENPFIIYNPPPIEVLQRFQIRNLVIKSVIFPKHMLLTGDVFNLEWMRSLVIRSVDCRLKVKQIFAVLNQTLNLEVLVLAGCIIPKVQMELQPLTNPFRKLRELELSPAVTSEADTINDAQELQMIASKSRNVVKLATNMRLDFHTDMKLISLTTSNLELIEKHGHRLRYLTLRNGAGRLTPQQLSVCANTLVKLCMDDFESTWDQQLYTVLPKVAHLAVLHKSDAVPILNNLISLNVLTHLTLQMGLQSKMDVGSLIALFKTNRLQMIDLGDVHSSLVQAIIEGNTGLLQFVKVTYSQHADYSVDLLTSLPPSTQQVELGNIRFYMVPKHSEFKGVNLKSLKLSRCFISRFQLYQLAVQRLTIEDGSIHLPELAHLVGNLSQSGVLKFFSYTCLSNSECGGCVDLLLNKLTFANADRDLNRLKLESVDAIPSQCRPLDDISLSISLIHALSFEDIILLTIACHKSTLKLKVRFNVYYGRFDYKDRLQANLNRFKKEVRNVVETRLLTEDEEYKKELIHYYENIDWNRNNAHPLYVYLHTIDRRLY